MSATSALSALLLLSITSAEWVEISQQHYRKHTKPTTSIPAVILHRGDDIIYNNQTINKPWNKGSVFRVPSAEVKVEHAQNTIIKNKTLKTNPTELLNGHNNRNVGVNRIKTPDIVFQSKRNQIGATVMRIDDINRRIDKYEEFDVDYSSDELNYNSEKNDGLVNKISRPTATGNVVRVHNVGDTPDKKPNAHKHTLTSEPNMGGKEHKNGNKDSAYTKSNGIGKVQPVARPYNINKHKNKNIESYNSEERNTAFIIDDSKAASIERVFDKNKREENNLSTEISDEDDDIFIDIAKFKTGSIKRIGTLEHLGDKYSDEKGVDDRKHSSQTPKRDNTDKIESSKKSDRISLAIKETERPKGDLNANSEEIDPDNEIQMSNEGHEIKNVNVPFKKIEFSAVSTEPGFITKDDHFSYHDDEHSYVEDFEEKPNHQTKDSLIKSLVNSTNHKPTQHYTENANDKITESMPPQSQTDTPDSLTAEKKPSPVENIIKVMKMVAETISKNTQSDFKSKINYLHRLKRTIMSNIAERIEAIWPDDVGGNEEGGRQQPRKVRQARGHVEFPSSEGALMTISFLTFAVFLIKLVLQVIHTYKNTAMPAVFTVSRAATAISRK